MVLAHGSRHLAEWEVLISSPELDLTVARVTDLDLRLHEQRWQGGFQLDGEPFRLEGPTEHPELSGRVRIVRFTRCRQWTLKPDAAVSGH